MHQYVQPGRRKRPTRDDEDENQFASLNGRPIASGYTQSARNASIGDVPENNVRRTLSTPNGVQAIAAEMKRKGNYGNIPRDRLVPQGHPRHSLITSSSSSRHSSGVEIPLSRTRGELGRRASIQSNPSKEDIGDSYRYASHFYVSML